ncbi:ABC transporter permease [Mesohalobacter halotolerans]|jgi:ABC-type transport system involved in multi-copper enzyme maturation permease subunit|uniref:ABC transporter permease n=1 Tax=Mesohalobacter halotolerans TaxID=1883405 RepID=A0A4V6ALA1_9FLAO|nr:ABC transporter permease [Mesohalobacter halotolerans]MBS3738033.1 ABC transporter permease [Psychroflexus sp.]NBC57053.1 ABC transporter permease subunit [Bacteroidota bacterium]TKS55795.1 ABC transporter permease [Mesohalobacter halotolerans]
MRRLINIELFKLRHSRSAKIMTILYFSLFLSAALLSTIKFDFGPFNFRLADQGIYNFPYTWHFMSFFVAFLKIILAIVIVSMMSSEYTNRTLKQNLIDGLSKKEFILSKFYVSVLYALCSTILLFVVTLVLGLIFSDYDEFQIIFSDLEYIGGYFVKLLGFFSLCLFLGLLVKRSAFALGFLFLLWIVEGIIGASLHDTKFDFISDYTPLNAMWRLIPEPITRLDIINSAAKQLNAEIMQDYSVSIFTIITVLAWTFLCVFGAYRLLKKRDL